MSENGDALYAWQVQEPDGRWSMILAVTLGPPMPMVHRDLEIMQRVKPIAVNHAEQTGQPLRLAEFFLSEVIE